MSIKWMYEELVATRLDGVALLLVLDLALHADAVAVCRTSVEKLAECTGLSERKVRRLLRKVHGFGYITMTPLSDSVLEIRVNCLQMLLGDPAVDGTPVVDEVDADPVEPLPHLSSPSVAPNWN